VKRIALCIVSVFLFASTAQAVQKEFLGVLAASKKAQTITWNTTPANMTVGDADQTLNQASATSGLAITYTDTSTPTICTIVSSKLHAVAAGDCYVHADQAGDGHWFSAAQATSGKVTISAGGGGPSCTAGSGDSALFTFNSATGVGTSGNSSTLWNTVRFVVAVPTKITVYRPELSKNSTTNNTIMSIYTSTSNHPNTEVSGSSVSVANSTMPAVYDYVNFTPGTPVTLSAGTYWLVGRGDSTGVSDWHYATHSGDYEGYGTNGTSWTVDTDYQMHAIIMGCQ
jgi:hypothetical protein